MLDANYHDDAGHFGGKFTPLRSGEVLELDPDNVVAPFPIRRVYWIFKTVSDAVRGRHAHKALWQLMSCPVGRCTVTLEDGDGRKDYLLDGGTMGLLVGPGVWREMRDFSPDCVLVVLASLPFDESDYVRDYAEFQAIIAT